MIDATNLGDDATSRQIAEEAREWIFGKDDSFVLMCHQSGLEPDYIARKTQEAMDYHANSIREESRCKERAFENMEALSA
ncbi:MAG: hypothetical protein EB127_12185 [Alphaproteobacteria bacterium]|nr:hypothetical protein [Alphaproteobacteria bacterium]